MVTPSHGDRRTYRRGCRCLLCRAANAAYEAARAAGKVGHAPDLVSADKAREHLRCLRAKGVGYRQAARLAGLSPQLVAHVRAGRVDRIRADTALRILAVKPALARGQVVPAWRTWLLLDSLLREGYTRAALGFRLGCRGGHLRIAGKLKRPATAGPDVSPPRRNVRVKTALKVRRLWHAITEDDLEPARERSHP